MRLCRNAAYLLLRIALAAGAVVWPAPVPALGLDEGPPDVRASSMAFARGSVTVTRTGSLDERRILILMEIGKSRIDAQGTGTLTDGATTTRWDALAVLPWPPNWLLSDEEGAKGLAVRIQAAQLRFQSDAGVSGKAAVDLRLAGDGSAPKWTGEVRIRNADYAPPRKKKRQEKRPRLPAGPAARPGPQTLDVAVRFDRDVWYKEGGTSIEFRGDLALRKEAYGPLRLLGTVEMVRGTYAFYRRNFDVQSGRMVLTEDNQSDPAISARALFTEPQNGTKVLLRIEGTVDHPRLTLTSEPPMESRDILSVLAFGRPLSEAGGGADRKASEAARQVLAGYLTDSLRLGVFRKLDLDVLQIRREPVTGQTDVTVGRYLTKDLFVSFGQTLGQRGHRRLNAEYTLTPHFSLEGRDSTDGKYIMDFLFKFGYK